jgi:hypothetical protein
MSKTRTSTDAHHAGRRARQRGLERLSPYYQDPIGDFFFLAGFDGVPLPKAMENYLEESGGAMVETP